MGREEPRPLLVRGSGPRPAREPRARIRGGWRGLRSLRAAAARRRPGVVAPRRRARRRRRGDRLTLGDQALRPPTRRRFPAPGHLPTTNSFFPNLTFHPSGRYLYESRERPTPVLVVYQVTAEGPRVVIDRGQWL